MAFICLFYILSLWITVNVKVEDVSTLLHVYKSLTEHIHPWFIRVSSWGSWQNLQMEFYGLMLVLHVYNKDWRFPPECFPDLMDSMRVPFDATVNTKMILTLRTNVCYLTTWDIIVRNRICIMLVSLGVLWTICQEMEKPDPSMWTFSDLALELHWTLSRK